MKNRVMITAHAGCEGTKENSMESVETGIALGADCVEVDVRMDQQGKLWISHDGQDAFEKQVSLEDVFGRVRESGIAVNCDLKDYKTILPVIRLSDAYEIGRDRLILSGAVDTFLLRDHPEISRRCRIFLNAEELARDLLPNIPLGRTETMKLFMEHPEMTAVRFHALGADALNLCYQDMQTGTAEEMRSKGIALSLWTVDEEEALHAWMKEEILNVTTRRVAKALSIRNALLMS